MPRPDANLAEKRRILQLETLYDLALALGASGIDPRPAARAALRLNPLEQITQLAVRRFDTNNPRRWRRTGRALARETEF